jgi:alpha-beta hydrolase superfamily lysophospholipase
MQRRAFLSGAAGLMVTGCGRKALLAGQADVTLTPLKSYSRLASGLLLRLAGVKGVPARHAVDCWRVVYGSHDGQGRPIRLSGLLALPRDVVARGLVSWQHGTTTTRTDVPSRLSTEGVAAAIVFAGSGFATVAPDYLGLGDSPLVHTYYAADDTARAVVDLLDAARTVPGVPDAPPFLAGFSQGGHACMAAHQALEAAGRTVLGSAPVAGAFNLRTLSVPRALKGGAVQNPLYLTYLTRGLAARYGQPLESALTDPVAALTRTLYDQPHKPDAIVAALPKNPRDLFNAGFLEAFDQNRAHWLLEALTVNEVSHFTPRAPVRLYYGDADEDVSPAESVTTAAMFRATGADATAVGVGPFDHNSSILRAAPRALAWLETLAGPRAS